MSVRYEVRGNTFKVKDLLRDACFRWDRWGKVWKRNGGAVDRWGCSAKKAAVALKAELVRSGKDGDVEVVQVKDGKETRL